MTVTESGRPPGSVTAIIAKSERSGRVFIDWYQNNPAKTTIAPGIGDVRARQLIERAGIAESRRVGGLGQRQREALLAAIN
jgi:hypothetical protein